MKSLRPGDDSPVRPSGQTSTDGGNGDERSAVVGNERLTALAGAVLLVLIVVELVTVPNLRALLSAHVLVGVLLAGPLGIGRKRSRVIGVRNGNHPYPLRLCQPYGLIYGRSCRDRAEGVVCVEQGNSWSWMGPAECRVCGGQPRAHTPRVVGQARNAVCVDAFQICLDKRPCDRLGIGPA